MNFCLVREDPCCQSSLSPLMCSILSGNAQSKTYRRSNLSRIWFYYIKAVHSNNLSHAAPLHSLGIMCSRRREQKHKCDIYWQPWLAGHSSLKAAEEQGKVCDSLPTAGLIIFKDIYSKRIMLGLNCLCFTCPVKPKPCTSFQKNNPCWTVRNKRYQKILQTPERVEQGMLHASAVHMLFPRHFPLAND